MVHRFSLLLTLALLPSCVTRSTVRDAPLDAGIQGTYRMPPEKVKQAALEALSECDFKVEEDVALEVTQWRVLAICEPARGTGRIARVLLEPRGSESSLRILVESKSVPREGEPSDASLAQSIHERVARKLGRPAPAPGGPPGTTVDVGTEKSFRSSFPLCLDAALKVCRDRDYVLRSQERTGDAGVLAVHGRGFDVTWTISRIAGNRSRAIVRVQGRASPENRDEALFLLNKLREALLEPLE